MFDRFESEVFLFRFRYLEYSYVVLFNCRKEGCVFKMRWNREVFSGWRRLRYKCVG